ncbi:hypothetical protein CHUAL_000672 [Chamberlinius hualienensis]
MSKRDTIIHLVGGGVGGTVGAIVTCPLEVVKTRLQSSVATFDYQSKCLTSSTPSSTTHRLYLASQRSTASNLRHGHHLMTVSPDNCVSAQLHHHQMTDQPRIGIWRCLRYIIEMEGVAGLFKGLGPNLIGVAPSRAIYFCTYSNAKAFLNQHLRPDSPLVHTCSAICAGFSASTATNPIWFVKTRLQLDQRSNGQLTTLQCVREIYRTKGIIGFYKGITASYIGISETVIHFVVYEAIKARLRDWRNVDPYTSAKTGRDFMEFMLAGAMSKTIASCLAYPHEVARTRLRQEGDKYRSFWQTVFLVLEEEGARGLYRGLCTQLLRQIPNTAVMMATYEAVVYLLSQYNRSYINM